MKPGFGFGFVTVHSFLVVLLIISTFSGGMVAGLSDMPNF